MLRFFALLQTDTTSILDRVPDDVRQRADEIVGTVRENPTLAAVLAVIGVLTLVLFLWGIVKQVIKAAIVGGVLSAGAWYWYFNVS